MQGFVIYGFDLEKEAQLVVPKTMSAAAKRALEKYSKLPDDVATTWKQQPTYGRVKVQSREEATKRHFEIRERELTDQERQEQNAVKLRHTTHTYGELFDEKANGRVQFGKVIEGPAQFYSARLPKKQRKQSLVDQLLDDQDEKV